jgi:transcriptional regulator with XRE-family HTH domain
MGREVSRASRYSRPTVEGRREYVAEDWAAVARAIDERMTELGLNQRELIERSRVSKTVVMEIRRNSAERRRSTRTLEALSTALEWHPQYLIALLQGRRLPVIGEPVSRSDDDIQGRLAVIEYRLDQIVAQLATVGELSGRLEEINKNVEAVMQFVSPDRSKR